MGAKRWEMRIESGIEKLIGITFGAGEKKILIMRISNEKRMGGGARFDGKENRHNTFLTG